MRHVSAHLALLQDRAQLQVAIQHVADVVIQRRAADGPLAACEMTVTRRSARVLHCEVTRWSAIIGHSMAYMRRFACRMNAPP